MLGAPIMVAGRGRGTGPFIPQDGVNSVVIDAKVVDLGMLILVDCFVSRLDGRRWPVQL